MPSYPVLQPNGKMAVWSSVVDHFIALECSVEGCVAVIAQRHSGDVRSAVEAAASGNDPFPPYGDWDMRLAWALYRFGEDDETVRKALAITPDPKAAQWYCKLIWAEAALDDAIARAERAEAALAERDRPCVWTAEQDGYSIGEQDGYSTGCTAWYSGNAILYGKFCPTCGHPIEVQA